MSVTKKCIQCHVEKVCHSDKSISEFYPRKPTKTNLGFDNTCKACCMSNTKKNRAGFSKKNSIETYITTESIISSLLGKFNRTYPLLSPEQIKSYTERLDKLAGEYVIEKRNEDRIFHILISDINVPKDRYDELKGPVISQCVVLGRISISSENVHIFHRKNHIKMVFDDENVFLTQDIKNVIKETISRID